jgi:hypothetical protein
LAVAKGIVDSCFEADAEVELDKLVTFGWKQVLVETRGAGASGDLYNNAGGDALDLRV